MFKLRYLCVVLCAVMGHTLAAHGQRCILGEAPSDFCPTARVIPGNPGQHVVLMDVSNATSSQEVECGINVGHTVWFEVTPAGTGPLTFSTCHPNTSYDTVVQAFQGGESSCEFMAPVACGDDTFEPECANQCSGYGSTISFEAFAGVRYRFVVGSFRGNAAGCPLCLGVILTLGQVCGDPPTMLACALAEELPGTPGTHEVNVDATDAIVFPTDPIPSCGANVGNAVWFRTTPTVNGPLTFTTCNPNTTYDTVVQAYRGDCAGLLENLGCSDDMSDPACSNQCGLYRASTVSFRADAGHEYLFQVGSYNHNAANCDVCLGATLTIIDECSLETTAPIAQITSPPALSCACNQVEIMGTAEDPDGTFKNYKLEFMPAGGGTWTTISASTLPVVNGPLGVWNTTGLPQGWYFVRVTATNRCKMESTAVGIVLVDKAFDSLDVRSPGDGAILGGQVCLDGTVWDNQCFGSYTVEYQSAGGGEFAPVEPATPVYHAAVISDPIAHWNTRAGIPDGDYVLRATGRTVCGFTDQETHQVTVDNTAPIAVIASPGPCSFVNGLVTVRGTAADAHLAGWALHYSGDGAHSWVTIASGTSQVINDVLGTWNTNALPSCAYMLRLVVADQAILDCNGAIHNQSEYLVSVSTGACGVLFDADGDNDVDLRDFAAFMRVFGGP